MFRIDEMRNITGANTKLKENLLKIRGNNIFIVMSLIKVMIKGDDTCGKA